MEFRKYLSFSHFYWRPRYKKTGVLLAFAGFLCLTVFVTGKISGWSLPLEKQPPVTIIGKGGLEGTQQVLRLVGARNEYVFFHFQVKEVDPSSVTIRIKGSGPLEKANFQFFEMTWAPSNIRDRYQADALIPLERGVIYSSDPLYIWVTFKIPDNTAVGVYRGIMLVGDKKKTFEVPLEIKVWNFTLPKDLPITILANSFVKPKWYARHGVKSRDSFFQTIKGYLCNMREYKINALGYFYPFPAKGLLAGKGVEDFPEYVEMLRYVVNDLGFRFFRIPPVGRARVTDQSGGDWPSQAKVYYPKFRDFLRRQGLEKRAIIKVLDEPPPSEAPNVVKVYKLIKSLVPEIKTESAGRAPNPAYAGLIDIWVSYATSYDPKAIDQARKSGQEIWLYANKLHGLDQPLVNQRLIGWYLYRYKFQGYLLWGMDDWKQDPWDSSSIRVNHRRGTFFYPDPRFGSPIPTTRLEALRTGFQDYQYFSLLEQAMADGHVSRSAANQVFERLRALSENLKSLSPNVTWAELEDLRLQIGELLDRAARGGNG